MYVCYSRSNLLFALWKTSRELWILNVADQADDVLLDDDGEETNDEEEFLEQSDTELSDEGMSKKTSISSILSV